MMTEIGVVAAAVDLTALILTEEGTDLEGDSEIEEMIVVAVVEEVLTTIEEGLQNQ